MASVSHRGFPHLGMDVSKDSILVAVLDPDRDDAPVDRIFNETESVRRLIGRLTLPVAPHLPLDDHPDADAEDPDTGSDATV